jgi:hypothetical protein
MRRQRIIEDGQEYVIRDGRRIRIETNYGGIPPRPPRTQKASSPFKAEWVKFPQAWREALRQANSNGATYDLALTVLFEAYKCERFDGYVTLSAQTTGMPKNTRRRAAKELVKLGLIKLHRTSGNQAYRVSLLFT